MAYSFSNWLNSARNLNAAEKQMSFQSVMSGSAHEREVQDLKNAGLNPVLSAGGSGASTPSGAYDEELAMQNMMRSTSSAHGVAKKAVKETTKATKSIAKDFGVALEKVVKNLNPNTSKGLVAPEMMPMISTYPALSFEVPELSKSAYKFDNFARRWDNKQLTWQDVKDYTSQKTGHAWYDTQLSAYMPNIGKMFSGVGVAGEYANMAQKNKNLPGSHFSINVRSKYFKEALDRMSEDGKKEYYAWLKKYGYDMK